MHARRHQIHSHLDPSLCLAVEGDSTDNGARIVTATCESKQAHNWKYDKNGRIRNRHSKKCIQRDGSRFVQAECSDSGLQQFDYTSDRELEVGGKCVDIRGAAATPGDHIIAHPCKGSPNQQWFTECWDESDCKSGRCDETTSKCRMCEVDADCSGDKVCNDTICVSPSAGTDTASTGTATASTGTDSGTATVVGPVRVVSCFHSWLIAMIVLIVVFLFIGIVGALFFSKP